MRRAIVAAAFAITAFVAVLSPLTVHAAEDVTPRDIDNFIVAYSVERSSAVYPYVRLVSDVRRVIDCESDHLDLDVINGRRHGAAGEIGPGQWLPGSGGIWDLTPSAQAGYPVTDPESNVAGVVWAISQGMGPDNWYWCWRSGHV